jgi:hypothetical protein
MPAKVTGECFVFVQGMSLNCPLCGVIVRSGEQHTCKELEAEAAHQKRLRRELKPRARKAAK